MINNFGIQLGLQVKHVNKWTKNDSIPVSNEN